MLSEDAGSPVFIFSSGRCGSTLLQTILNTNPEFLIWGEHAGFLSDVARAYFRLKTSLVAPNISSSGIFAEDEARLRDLNQWGGFVNPKDLNAYMARMRTFVLSLFANSDDSSRRWGFKEIKYARSRRDLTPQFLFECFPNANMLILVRNPVDTIFSILSAWCREVGADVKELDRELFKVTRRWTIIYERLFLFHHASGGHSRILRFEDFNQKKFDDLAEFLKTEKPFDYARATEAVHEPSERNDQFADLIRSRAQVHHRILNHLTEQTRLIYGYPTGWKSN